jgi:hypothetical protein
MKKLVLALLVLSTVAFVALRRGGDDTTSNASEVTESKLVLDRIWIDHIPRNDRDTFQLFVAITEQPFGIFQATSQWKGQYELFQYEAHGDELRLVYGQNGDKDKVKAHATKCNQGGMDYCLELKGASRGVKKYYSMEDWVIDGRMDTIDHLRARVQEKLNTPVSADE